MEAERNADGLRRLDVLERVLDRGIVCKIRADIALVGIDLITVRESVVVASIDACLRYAAAGGAALPAAPGSEEGVRPGAGLAAREASKEQRGPASALPAPEAVVQAAEAYLRQLRRGARPGDGE